MSQGRKPVPRVWPQCVVELCWNRARNHGRCETHRIRPNREPRSRSGKRDDAVTFECEVCGVETWVKWNSIRDKRRWQSGWLSCQDCAQSVVAAYVRGDAPRSQWRSPVAYKKCEICSRLFVHRGNRKSTCSSSCTEIKKNRRAAGRINSLYAATKNVTRPWESKNWRLYLVNYLRQRDSERCTLCGFTIDFTAKSGPKGSPWGASIDHIKPKSHGGSDDLKNLALTHWRCNYVRRTQDWERVA